MKRTYEKVAFDCSSWMWTNLSGGRDDENGIDVEIDGKKKRINSAYHGYDKCVRRMHEVLTQNGLTPIDMILVFEGKNSKAKRLMIDPSYKGGSGRASHAPEEYDQFHKLKEMLAETWCGLGAVALTQDMAEGDDVLAWLAINTEVPMLVATFDNDLCALNMDPNPHGVVVETWIDGALGVNKYGVFDYHLVTAYKALVGDSSDNIKGCPNFGPKKFENFCTAYGYDGLQELQNMLMAHNLDPQLDVMAESGKHPLVKMIVENRGQVQNSFDLARLRPEWVDTMQQPLQWRAGHVKRAVKNMDPLLRPWAGSRKLVTRDNFQQAVDWAMPQIRASREVALDIETSTPEESDAWLEAQRTKTQRSEGVDVFGSTLTGLALTFGPNNQYTFYISVDHVDTENVPSEWVREFIASIPREIPIVIQNTAFELVVLDNEWGDKQRDNGYHGFLPNVLDSLFEGSYVNENMALGLKERSEFYLGYKQQTYDETVNITGAPGTLPKGGRLLSENHQYEMVPTGKVVADIDGNPTDEPEMKRTLVEYDTGEVEVDDAGNPVLKKGKPIPVMAPVVESITRRYKMNELTAQHVFNYGCDDTICTIALHNFYKLHMQLEHHWNVYLQVEIDAAYQHAKNFIDGVPISLEELNRQTKADNKNYDKAWGTLRTYLMKNGWAGTQPPTYTKDITVAEVKEAYKIVTGEALDTMMRTMSKLITYIREAKEQPVLAALLERMVEPREDAAMVRMHEKAFTDYVRSKFSGEPEFNDSSPLQMCRLMYEVLKAPIMVRNKPTEIMRSKGIYEGNPKADALAIEYALRDLKDDKEKVDVLNALKIMSMVGTRRSLYYDTYPHFPHWKDGKVRSTHRQCGTNTRRASEAKPNKQQLPKHPKMEGYAAAFRRVIVPHKPGAVVVSIDFAAQELRIIAERSQDPTALSMFVGDKLTEPHDLTGLGIIQRTCSDRSYPWTYEAFVKAVKDLEHELHKEAKEARRLGKKLNFVAEYGAMAEKVAATLMVSIEEAQEFLDAREDMFPVVKEWKQSVIAKAKKTGKAHTMLGAVRHLRELLNSEDRFEASKAERQAVNFEVQGPSAEQTKEAEGRMWKKGLFFRYDAVCYGPIHDEIVMSVMIKDLEAFLPEAHACMTVQYAGMKVPCIGSISFGANFYDQVEIGNEPAPAAIQKGLADMKALVTKLADVAKAVEAEELEAA